MILKLDKHPEFYKRWISSQRQPHAHKHTLIQNTQRMAQDRILFEKNLYCANYAHAQSVFESAGLFLQFQDVENLESRLALLEHKNCTFYRNFTVGYVVDCLLEAP